MATMKPGKLTQRLETVDKKLQEAKNRLIRCEPLDDRVLPLLNQIADILKFVGSDPELSVDCEGTRQLLKAIQTGTKSADVLLESAAKLMCHSALTTPLIKGSYTPDGEFPSLQFDGRLIVHA